MANIKPNISSFQDPPRQAYSAPAHVANGHGMTLLMFSLPIIGATFVSKLGLPFIQEDGIGMGFPFLYLPLVLGLFLAGRMRLEAARLQFFCLMAGIIGVVTMLKGENISLPSLAFLMLLHLPYVVYIETGEHTRAAVQRLFLNVAMIIALCGLAQYVLQPRVSATYLFPIETFLPASWRVTGFNMLALVSYGSSFYRPNGVFMQEPSFFSQLLAIAVLIELLGPNRLWRVALYIVAIVASRSGTGLALLAVCLPVLIVARRRWDLVIAAAAIIPLLLLASPYLHTDQLLARIGEFTSERSSAYARFVGGFHIFDASVGADPLRLLFGYGAGTYRDIVHSLDRNAAEMALFKIVVEYGVIGALLYFGFIFYCIFSARGAFVLRLALAMCLFLNGAYNTFVHSLALALLVWSSSPSARKTNRAETERTRSYSTMHPATERPAW